MTAGEGFWINILDIAKVGIDCVGGGGYLFSVPVPASGTACFLETDRKYRYHPQDVYTNQGTQAAWTSLLRAF